VLCAAAALLLPMATAHAAVTISSATTKNISCTSGVCTPTAKNAILNAGDLATMLASGNVTVNTGTGSLARQVEDILVGASFNWTSAGSLTLDAFHSITFKQPVADNGSAAVSFVTNDGGSGGYLSFGAKGSLSFLGTANTLSINGTSFALENSIATLASAIKANPAGHFALANSYDASADGTYSNTPITTTLTGTVEGLGNTISHLTIAGGAKGQSFFALFLATAAGSAIESMKMTGVSIDAKQGKHGSGGVSSLVCLNSGLLFDDHAAGTLTAKFVDIGGLAGSNNTGGMILNSSTNMKIKSPNVSGGLAAWNSGTISLSSANGAIAGVNAVGGLVGDNDGGTITESFATGSATATNTSVVGGLVGISQDSETPADVSNSYATGAATGSANSEAGGFIGENDATIEYSYSTGTASSGSGSLTGGFAGTATSFTFADCYWDTTTSGMNDGIGGENISGITGLTTTQLQSGLPTGFDPTIWAQSPSINGGLPYLIANPPR
jgi:hypothetical protein